MTLRPNDYDKYGDIIPSGWKEEKGDLISRSALKEAFLNHSCTEFEIKNMCRADENVIALIDNAPTVEAVPLDFHEKCMDWTVRELLEKERPQGEWLIEGGTTLHYACSECGCAGDEWDKFCKHCGADMRKKEGDNK